MTDENTGIAPPPADPQGEAAQAGKPQAAAPEVAARRVALLVGDEVQAPPRPRGRPRKDGDAPAVAPGQAAPKPVVTAEQLKAMLRPELVDAWRVFATQWTLMVSIAIAFIWTSMPMTDDEREAHTRAWCVYLTLNPPANLGLIAKWNLAFVYFTIFAPRIGTSVRRLIAGPPRPPVPPAPEAEKAPEAPPAKATKAAAKKAA